MGALRKLLAASLPFGFGTVRRSPEVKAQGAPFDHILNWRLLSGMHDFPGPDGGTCVNEAAIVAAGLSYRAVVRPQDLPACFSPVIGAYTIRLNDGMPNEPRQKLLPYVTRLAGTADDFAIECRRTECLALAAVRVVAANALRRAGLTDHAAAWAAVRDLDGAVALFPKWEVNQVDSVKGLRHATHIAHSAAVGARECHQYGSLCLDAADDAGRAVIVAARVAVRVADDTRAQLEVWDEALAALDDMLAIGNQAGAVEPAVASERMAKAKRAALQTPS